MMNGSKPTTTQVDRMSNENYNEHLETERVHRQLANAFTRVLRDRISSESIREVRLMNNEINELTTQRNAALLRIVNNILS